MKSFVVQYIYFSLCAMENSCIERKMQQGKMQKEAHKNGKMEKVTSDGKVIWGKSIF